jgi:hypothetical protein
VRADLRRRPQASTRTQWGAVRRCQRVRHHDGPTSQYCPVRSADFCRYGPTSHSLYLPQVLHRVVRPRIDERPCEAAEFASGFIANGLVGSMVIYCCQAKQIPSADAFPRKPSPSSLSLSAHTGEFAGASPRLGSPGPTSGFDRRSGSGVVGCGAQLVGPRNAGCRCASIEGKIMRKTVDVYVKDRLVASYPIVVRHSIDLPMMTSSKVLSSRCAATTGARTYRPPDSLSAARVRASTAGRKLIRH